MTRAEYVASLYPSQQHRARLLGIWLGRYADWQWRPGHYPVRP